MIYRAHMRTTHIILVLACFGCGYAPSDEDKALVADIESRVSLPKGGGKLQCYKRLYAIFEGEEINKHWGTHIPHLFGRKLVEGRYIFGGRPGIYWTKNAKDLEPEIMDGGCNDIFVEHLTGDPPEAIHAECSADISGGGPEEISPPRDC